MHSEYAHFNINVIFILVFYEMGLINTHTSGMLVTSLCNLMFVFAASVCTWGPQMQNEYILSCLSDTEMK